MRYIKELLTQARRQTGNETFSSTSGISQDTLLEYVNDAQDHLQAVIVNKFPIEFVVQKIISVVSGQEEYTIDDNVFVNNRLLSLQYSTSGLAADYYSLRQKSVRDRITDTDTHPSFYIRRSGKILLNPIPSTSTGKLRVEYYRELDTVDIVRGNVSSTTLSGANLVDITLADDSDLDTAGLSEIGGTRVKYICFNNNFGEVTDYAIPILSYNSSNRVLTLDTTTPYPVSASPGLRVTLGKYSTTHSKLPENCERYLKAYLVMKILMQDSSADVGEATSELSKIEQDILSSFGDVSEDLEHFPVLDWDIIY